VYRYTPWVNKKVYTISIMRNTKERKNFFVFAASLFATILLTPMHAFAITAITFENPLGQTSIRDLLEKILDFLTQLGAVVAVIFVVYAGFRLVFARGNEAELTKAKQTLVWALVGAAIVLGAFMLAEVINNTANELRGDAGGYERVLAQRPLMSSTDYV
jgi:type IV secretory pathway VirB2 component (pilin)